MKDIMANLPLIIDAIDRVKLSTQIMLTIICISVATTLIFGNILIYSLKNLKK